MLLALVVVRSPKVDEHAELHIAVVLGHPQLELVLPLVLPMDNSQRITLGKRDRNMHCPTNRSQNTPMQKNPSHEDSDVPR